MPAAIRIFTAVACATVLASMGLAQAAGASKPSRPRSYADRAELLVKLGEKLECKTQEPRKGWCLAAEGYRTGTAGEFTPGAPRLLVGLSMRVDLGGGDVAVLEEPVISAIAVRKEGRLTLGATMEVRPSGSGETTQFKEVASALKAMLDSNSAAVSLPETFHRRLAAWADRAGLQMYNVTTGWEFAGTMGELRRVGDFWVMLGAPRRKTGILLGIYTEPTWSSPDAGTAR